jgi:CRISPR-associated exonuclease Cas4
MIGAVLLLLALLALLAFAFTARKPLGVVMYTDTDQKHHGETLVAHRYRLCGRPDYIIRTKTGAIPVEVKSRHCGAHGPYPSEKAQLYAYCLLVEEALGLTVTEGVLEYPNRKYRVPFGPQERGEIITLLDEMHAALHHQRIPRSHNEPRRCRACGVRASCGEAL